MAVVTQAMQDQVTELYIAFFGRAPDASGFSFWTNALANGKTPQQIADVFMKSPEFSAQYDGLTPSQQVDKIYLNVLNRDATTDPTGKAFWVNALNSGVSVGQVAWSVVNSAWEQGTATADGKLVHNKVSVGEYFALTLASNDTAVAATAYKVNGVPVVTSDASSVATAEAALTQAVNAGATFTLTTNADNIVGTDKNDTINGYIDVATAANTTFQVIDTIDGKGGVNTLNLTVAGANGGLANSVTDVLPAANVTNVQVYSVRDVTTSTNANSIANYNMALYDGETVVQSNNSSHAVRFSSIGNGTTVGVAGTTTGAIQFTESAAANTLAVRANGATGSANISNIGNTTDASGTATTATAATLSTVYGAAASTLGTVKFTTNGTAAGGTGQTRTTGSSGTLTSLVVDAQSNLTATLNAGDFAATATLTVTGGGAVNLGANFAGNVINAATNSGGLTITAAASTKTITGGTGADVITLGGALTATGTVDLAAGNDTFSSAAASVASTNVVDGGTGTDTLALVATSLANASAFKNFELLNVDALAAATYDVSLLSGSNTFTGLVVNATEAAVAATISNVAAGVGLTAIGAADFATNGANYTIVQTGASTGTADSFNVSFAATGTAAEAQSVNLTLNNIETVNVASGGGTGDTNTFNLTATTFAQATASNIVTETVVITGANQLTTSVAAATAANTKVVVDASAATGVQLIIGGASTTSITGGAAADTLTVAATSNTTLYGGASNDTFVADLNVYGAAATKYLTTLADATAGDIVSVSLVGPATAGTLGAATSIAGSTDLNSALQLLATAADASARGTAWAVIAGNTYIVADTAAGSTLANDNVVKLVGTYALANSTITAGGDITLV